MQSLDSTRHLFAFDRWANERLVVALNQVEDPSEELRRIAWHLFAALENWSARIDGTVPAVDLEWDDHTLAEITALTGRAHSHITDILDRIREPALRARFDYRNSSGERFEQRVDDVLQHLVLHDAEHRGQCWLLIGHQGGPVVETEYAWYLRERDASQRQGDA